MDSAVRQTIRLDIALGGGATVPVDVDVWQDADGLWQASATTKGIGSVAASTRMKVLTAIRWEATRWAMKPLFQEAQFNHYLDILQGRDSDFGPGWEEEATRELLALSRAAGAKGRQFGRADEFLLWLGKRIAGEAIYLEPARLERTAEQLQEWHNQLARIVTSASPWASRRNGGNIHTPIADRKRAKIFEALTADPVLKHGRKTALRLVGKGGKGAVDREAKRKRNPSSS